MNGTRATRVAKITVSAMGGVACLTMIVLWIRSNWYLEEFWFPMPSNHGLGFVSAVNCGSVGIQERKPNPTSYIVGYRCAAIQIEGPKPIFLGFSLASDASASFLNVPYWFLVLLSVTIAVAPQIGWSRRFSLRTLLITVTLTAVVLGVVAVATRQ
jgi:hypothetical protein